MKAIKDGNNRVIALIHESGQQKKIFSADGVRFLGHYNAVSNATFDRANNRIGNGDLTAMLIR